MQIEQDISLTRHNTLGCAVRAEYFAHAQSDEDIREALDWARQKSQPVFVLGGGSNIVLTKNIAGLVLYLDTRGIAVVDEKESAVELAVQAGENWHRLVQHCINNGHYGIENLSLIPGSVGAAPVQNIGAYGVELSEVFISLHAIDIATGECVTINKCDCAFGYRSSIFKHAARGRYLITRVNLQLAKYFAARTDYGGIKQMLLAQGCASPNAQDVSEAICRIRRSKLPDPARLANVGSFFTNPEIDAGRYRELQVKFPGIVGFAIDSNRIKLAAGWLVEHCGWKGHREDSAGVHSEQSLVLVNYDNGSGEEVVALAEKIRTSVSETFGVQLTIEPLVL